MNANIESLKKIHGDKAESVFREIADRGGFGNVPSSYDGGLDVAGILAESNTEVSSDTKDRIAKLVGVNRKEADKIVDARWVSGFDEANQKSKQEK